jgi:pimeloyl-ACP methyl ester carboxylesterase
VTGPLAVEIAGSGSAVVLLHAFPLDRRMWRGVTPALAARHRVVAIDLPGFGESPLSSEPWSVDDAADAVIARLDGLGVVSPAIVGLSMGGYVALAIAARHPGRVGALVLCDTRAGADGPPAREGRDAGRAALARGEREAFLGSLLDRLVAPGAPAEIRAELRRLADAQTTDALRAALLALRDRPDRTALLPSLRLPALVMVGAEDALTPPSEARAIAGAIPGAALVEIAGAGHLSAVEQPAAFASALLDFLSSAI